MLLIDWLSLINVADILDIFLMSLLIYIVLVWIKESKVGFALIGIAIVAGVYLFAWQFNMTLTTTVFHGFFTVIIITVIIIFQEEIRSFFERIAVLFLNYRIHYRKTEVVSLHPDVSVLVRTLFDLARDRIGALVVIRAQDFLARHLEGGIELEGKLSEALLKSIFDPHSIGHDGAVVLDKAGVVKAFAVHLPLSKNVKELGQKGTRHAAALGLSEKTDALCLVVSEERGTVSVARRGQLETMSTPGELETVMTRFYAEMEPATLEKPWKHFYQSNYREKMIALISASFLWVLLVYGSEIIYRTYSLPVILQHLPRSAKVENVEPSRVNATFSGPRRNFYFLNKDKLKVNIDAGRWNTGENEAMVSFNEVLAPQGIVLRNLDTQEVKAVIKKK